MRRHHPPFISRIAATAADNIGEYVAPIADIELYDHLSKTDLSVIISRQYAHYAPQRIATQAYWLTQPKTVLVIVTAALMRSDSPLSVTR